MRSVERSDVWYALPQGVLVSGPGAFGETSGGRQSIMQDRNSPMGQQDRRRGTQVGGKQVR